MSGNKASVCLWTQSGFRRALSAAATTRFRHRTTSVKLNSAESTDKRLQEFSVGDFDKPGWRRAAFSPDGNTLALSDQRGNQIVFFDIAMGKEIHCLTRW